GRRLAVASLRDAADRQERGALILRLDQRDVRRQRDEILRALDAGRADVLLAECRHRDRHVLKRFLTPSGSYDDFLEIGSRGLGRGGTGGELCRDVTAPAIV